MPGHFQFVCDRIAGDDVFFGEAESKHMLGVLRYTVGDRISFTDGNGLQGQCRLLTIGKTEVVGNIERRETHQRIKHLTLCIGILRQNDRMEWFVEKGTELGVERIVFINCAHSQKPKVKMDRFHKKALSALKQSHGCFLPQIEMLDFADALDIEGNKYIAFCNEAEDKELLNSISSEAVVYIGPEGDFSQAEIDMAMAKGAKPLELGKNILRTETAALLVCGVHYL